MHSQFNCFSVPGPPASLTLINKTESTLKIKWEPPAISNVGIQEYQVSAVPTSSYSLSSVALPMEWSFPNSSLQQDLLGLQSGTNYNVSVRAKSLEGYGTPVSKIYSTEIGSKELCFMKFFCKNVEWIFLEIYSMIL